MNNLEEADRRLNKLVETMYGMSYNGWKLDELRDEINRIRNIISTYHLGVKSNAEALVRSIGENY